MDGNETASQSRYQLVSLDTDSGKDPLVVNETLLDELISQASSKNHVPVISFTGGYGVGKTTLITKLVSVDVDVKDWPSVASAHQLEPETCGLHVYPGMALPRVGSNGPVPRTILVDTEGVGGQLPREVNKRLREEILMPQWLHSIVNEHSSKRRALAQKVLPSLAFLLSDVVVYVHQNPTQDSNILGNIINIAKAANEDTEHPWKPALVIVQNKHFSVHDNDFDITEAFFKDIFEASDLQNLFLEVVVIRVPTLTQKELYQQAISVLRTSLSRLCNKVALVRKDLSFSDLGAPMLFPETVFWELCQSLLHVTNREIQAKGYNSPLKGLGENLVSLASERLRPLKTKDAFFDRFFAEIRAHVADKSLNSSDGLRKYRESYQKMAKVALQCLSLSIAFELSLNAPLLVYTGKDILSTFEQDVLEILENASRVVRSSRPCMANTPGPMRGGVSFPCTLTAEEHGEFHENAKAAIARQTGCLGIFEKLQNKWKGDVEGVLNLSSHQHLINDIRDAVDGKGVREIVEAQGKVLHQFFGPDVCNKTSVCCICLGRNVDVFLPCGHAICSADHKLKALSRDKVFLCPFPHNELASSSTTQSIDESYQNDDPVAVPEAENVGIRVLALDGGGVLGLVQVAVLCQIHRLVSDFAPDIQMHELFDLIIGTSIGSLIGSTIGLLHKNPSFLKEFLRHVKKVFQKVGWRRFSGGTFAMLSGSKYSNGFLVSQLRDMFEDLNLNGDDIAKERKDQIPTTSASLPAVLSSQKSSSGNKSLATDSVAGKTGRRELRLPVVACPVHDVDEQTVVTFSGYNCSHRAADAILASMAAPTYFPPVKLFSNGQLRKYCDGGVGANCPAVEGRKLAKEIWPDKPVDLMLSLACRGRPPDSASTNSNISGITKSAVLFISRTEQIWDEMEKDNDCFVRVSPKNETRISDWALDNTDVETLQGLVDEWIDKPATQRQLRDVACMLSAKFFYLGSFTPEVARWRPGQTCRVGIFQRKTRYTLKETDFRVVVKIGNSEVLFRVQHDPIKDGGFFVEFVCPRRDLILSVQLCILGAEVDVAGSPFVFSVK